MCLCPLGGPFICYIDVLWWGHSVLVSLYTQERTKIYILRNTSQFLYWKRWCPTVSILLCWKPLVCHYFICMICQHDCLNHHSSHFRSVLHLIIWHSHPLNTLIGGKKGFSLAFSDMLLCHMKSSHKNIWHEKESIV